MMKHGFRHAFRLMSPDIVEYRKLCVTIEYLSIDPLLEDGLDAALILRNMVDHGIFTGSYTDRMGDWAFKLLYIFLLCDLRRECETPYIFAAELLTVHLVEVPNFMEAWSPELGWMVKGLVLKACETRFGVSD